MLQYSRLLQSSWLDWIWVAQVFEHSIRSLVNWEHWNDLRLLKWMEEILETLKWFKALEMNGRDFRNLLLVQAHSSLVGACSLFDSFHLWPARPASRHPSSPFPTSRSSHPSPGACPRSPSFPEERNHDVPGSERFCVSIICLASSSRSEIQKYQTCVILKQLGQPSGEAFVTKSGQERQTLNNKAKKVWRWWTWEWNRKNSFKFTIMDANQW